MIISHKHQFIFIKTKKVAGTSIEAALGQFCGKEDIITPSGICTKELSPQNYKKKVMNMTPRDWGKFAIEGSWPKQFYNHMSAREISSTLEGPVWRDYTKFTMCEIRMIEPSVHIFGKLETKKSLPIYQPF